MKSFTMKSTRTILVATGLVALLTGCKESTTQGNYMAFEMTVPAQCDVQLLDDDDDGMVDMTNGRNGTSLVTRGYLRRHPKDYACYLTDSLEQKQLHYIIMTARIESLATSIKRDIGLFLQAKNEQQPEVGSRH